MHNIIKKAPNSIYRTENIATGNPLPTNQSQIKKPRHFQTRKLGHTRSFKLLVQLWFESRSLTHIRAEMRGRKPDQHVEESK